MLADLTKQLLQRQNLADDAVAEAISELVSEAAPPEAKADFLCALAAKGETVDEIAAFAAGLRELSVPPPLSATLRGGVILDVCGTGGDRLNTFNISTTVAIVAATAGIPVAKHGNRAITSQCGSSEVLEALGIRIDLKPDEAARALEADHFAFFFAPNYHPAFRHIAPARKLCAERGSRTVFNFLGPLLNPARPTAQLVGVPRSEFCEPIAAVLQKLGVRRGMVVCGRVPTSEGPRHLDEFSTLDATRVAEFHQERGFHVSDFDASALPLQPGSLGDLVGGDRQQNAAIVRAVLRGGDRGPRRDAVLLNAAAALFVAGAAPNITEGWELAARLIDSGRASAKLDALATR